MSDYIHGGTDPKEVDRLIKQAGFLAPSLLRDFQAAPGYRVLDLATGVGAMAKELITRYPGIQLFGAELRMSQLRSAQRHCPEGIYVQANGAALPFADQSFDRVHCSWLLEHVPTPPGPVAVLKEVRRVLKPDGWCHFIEVENDSFALHPANPVVTSCWNALNDAQISGGGDPFIGPKLEGYFQEAGFSKVIVERKELRGDASNPEFFSALLVEFAEIFESVDEVLPNRVPELHAAAQWLRDLLHKPGAWFSYAPYIVRASP